MGALPAIKRFLAEDYPTESNWIGTLLYPLNLLLTTIYSNLNNGLTIAQNLQSQINSATITGAAPTTSFKWNYSQIVSPVGVSLVYIAQTNAPVSTIMSATTVAWSYAAGIVTINNVTGLTRGNVYTCTFIVWGG